TGWLGLLVFHKAPQAGTQGSGDPATSWSPPPTRVLPPGVKVSHPTTPGTVREASGCGLAGLRTSHRGSLSSQLPTASTVPSGLNGTALTGPAPVLIRASSEECAGSAMFHNSTAWWDSAVARTRLSGLTATALTTSDGSAGSLSVAASVGPLSATPHWLTWVS